jgi:hypothetical protein
MLDITVSLFLKLPLCVTLLLVQAFVFHSPYSPNFIVCFKNSCSLTAHPQEETTTYVHHVIAICNIELFCIEVLVYIYIYREREGGGEREREECLCTILWREVVQGLVI